MTSFLNEKQIQTFKSLLEQYKPNDQALDIFRASNFGVISGPVAAGKNTLREGLIKQNPQNYISILSTTTRPKREHEVDGRDYHFKSIDEVRMGLERGNYLQGALVHNQQISALDVAEISKLGTKQTGLGILIVQTEEELYRFNQGIKTIFLTPPSLNDLMERLRTTRNLPEDEISRRLAAAKKELEIALKNQRYYCLISEDVKANIKRADKFFENGYINEDVDAQARKNIEQLLDDLNKEVS